jgi:hypothetical protein
MTAIDESFQNALPAVALRELREYGLITGPDEAFTWEQGTIFPMRFPWNIVDLYEILARVVPLAGGAKTIADSR